VYHPPFPWLKGKRGVEEVSIVPGGIAKVPGKSLRGVRYGPGCMACHIAKILSTLA
jgi:hypothetical protein